MPILKPGQKVRTYEIARELNRGAFAIAYEARDLSGGKVFFKNYKSPTKLVDWYSGFVEHQKEIKARINKDPAAKDRCYKFIDFFEEAIDPGKKYPSFYQVYEFVEGGKDLTKVLEEHTSFTEEQFALFAKVMMFGMRALHTIKIVHTDLKPDNIILIPDPATNNYRLRIIDMDWAIFADKQAPWHGKQGYTGTPGYQSPEHLRGEIPLPASDIFTCGIMLGQVLGQGHPFADSGDNYDKDIQAGRFRPIRLRLPLPGVSDPAFVEAIINSCLNPDPKKRPTAVQVCDALMGKTFAWHSAPAPAVKKTTPPPSPVDTPAAVAKKIEIYFDGKLLTSATVDCELGKRNFKGAHADAQFLSDPQFKLHKQGGKWVIEHASGATNETIVNGHKLAGSEPVSDGMRVAVGNSAKGVEKFALTVKLS